MVSPGNPLKPEKGMAPFEARLASARRMARHAPLAVFVIVVWAVVIYLLTTRL